VDSSPSPLLLDLAYAGKENNRVDLNVKVLLLYKFCLLFVVAKWSNIQAFPEKQQAVLYFPIISSTNPSNASCLLHHRLILS
jgi:hypothetical protein